ncbi:Rrf2 family transcriptional regulator [Paenibacillus psychroresistens]|uniref:Rrf2 family transcriptional regulator n=1 Tax=Paenibacillus psychroresistens TaxID=1778678 RepID=A0A6B8RN97_9BACL|nr:Rrf2 family transcriptional regulator [Paenibacillus psychroresistens]QGQ97509.1 Rrf2 family transcriptional regulator [Paenibacillus psychroresistens]
MNMDKCIGSHHPKWFGLAVQALVILAKDDIITCPSAELAVYLQSEPTLLRRILSSLTKGGILETREGRDGGYKLRRSPETITLAEVYTILQVSAPLIYGIKDTAGTGTFGLKMNTLFGELTDEMDRSLLEVLGNYTIGDWVKRLNETQSGGNVNSVHSNV